MSEVTWCNNSQKKKKKSHFWSKLTILSKNGKCQKNHRKLHDLDFSHKMGIVGKIWSCFKKGGYLLPIFIQVTLSDVNFAESDCACVFCLFAPYLNILCVMGRILS